MQLNQSPYLRSLSSTVNFQSSLKSKFMNRDLKKNIKANEKIGHFIPKQKRAEISKDIRDTHFKLGFDCKSKFITTCYSTRYNIHNTNMLTVI